MLLSAALAATAGGCADETDSTGTIPMGKIPAAVIKVAQAKLPGVAFETAIEEKISGKVSYELHGRDKKGKEQKVKISRDGKVLSEG